MQRGSASISKPPHTNKAEANENERATGIDTRISISLLRRLVRTSENERWKTCLKVAGCYESNYDHMASLHKDPRGKSPFWYCAYTLPNGNRVLRSTKLTDRKAAEAFRDKLEYASH
jgi:hypothetical protein